MSNPQADVLNRAAELLKRVKLEKNGFARDAAGQITSFLREASSLSLLGAVYKAASELGYPTVQVQRIKEELVLASFDLELDVADEGTLAEWANEDHRTGTQVIELLQFTARKLENAS